MVTQEGIPVTNRGKTYTINKAQVQECLKAIPPQRIIRYGVEIGGREYPLRQVLAAVTKTPEIEWSTTNAYRILQKLGFEILIH